MLVDQHDPRARAEGSIRGMSSSKEQIVQGDDLRLGEVRQLGPVDSIDLRSEASNQFVSLVLERDATRSAIVGIDRSTEESSPLEPIDDPADVRAACHESRADRLEPDALGFRGRHDAEHVVLALRQVVFLEEFLEVLGEKRAGADQIQIRLPGRKIERPGLADLFCEISRWLVRGFRHRGQPIERATRTPVEGEIRHTGDTVEPIDSLGPRGRRVPGDAVTSGASIAVDPLPLRTPGIPRHRPLRSSFIRPAGAVMVGITGRVGVRRKDARDGVGPARAS